MAGPHHVVHYAAPLNIVSPVHVGGALLFGLGYSAWIEPRNPCAGLVDAVEDVISSLGKSSL